MFSLRTTRGRLAALSVALAVIVLPACITTDQTAPVADDPADDPVGEDDPAGSDDDGAGQDGTDQDEGAGSDADVEEQEADEQPEEGTVGLASASLRTCHDRNDAGGNSDVVVELTLDGVEPGATVELAWTSSAQGDGTATGTVDDTGTAVVLLPATEFGEQFTISSVSVDGTAVDPAGVDLSHTVPDGSGSDCTNHPEA